MLTLADADNGGVIIRDIKQDSEIAKASTLKKASDQIYGGTIYFDNMSSRDVAQILKYSETCKPGLKLHSDDEIKSPDALKLRNFSLKNLDTGDQTYADIYNKKIKKHLKLSTPNINAQNADPKIIKLPDLDIRGPSFGIPSFKEKGVDVDVNLPHLDKMEIKGDMKSPKGAIDINMPDAKPKFTTPKYSLSGQKGNLPDVDLPGVNIKGDMKPKDIDFKSPKGTIDINMPDAEFKSPKVEMPSLNLQGPNISEPDGDLGFKVPNIKGVSPNLDGKFKSPTMDVNSPDVDLNVPDINPTFWDKLKFPKFKKPNLSISEPDVKMPGLGTNLPETNIKLPSGKVKLPNLDVKTPELDLKAPKFDAKTPNLDIKAPRLDVKAPKIDSNDFEVNVPKPKIKTSTFKLPSLNFNSSKPDVNLKTPKLSSDVDLPKFSLKSPNIDLNKPNIDLNVPSGKMKMPSVDLPSFSTPNINIKKPDFDLDGKLKMPNVKMKKGINIPDVDIQGPKGDLGIDVPDVNLQSKKFKMPTFNAPGGNVSVPDIDLNLKKPGITDNMNLSFPKTKGEFHVPGIDVNKPSFEMNNPNINLHGPSGTLPDVNFEDRKAKIKSMGIKLPSLNTNTKGIDLTAPKLTTNFKSPKLDIESPDLDINTPKPGDIGLGGNFNLPKFTTPKYSLSGQKGNLPDVDLPGVNIKGDMKPKGIDFKSPKGTIDINMPDAEFKSPKVEMPSLNLQGPNISGPDGDLGFKVPNIKGVSPNLDGKFKRPTMDVDLNVPDTNPKFWDKLKFPKFKKPNLSISEPDVKMPGLGTNLPETNFKLPSGKMKLPNLDVKTPELDLKAPKFDVKTPNLDIKAPSLDVKAPKIDSNDFEVNIPKPKIKTSTFKLPSLNFNSSKPDVNLKTPKVSSNVDLPKFSLKSPNIDLNKPNLNLKTPHLDLKAPDLDVNVPKVDIKTPGLDMDLNGPKIKSPTFKMPSLNLPGFNTSKPDVDLSAPDLKADFNGPRIDGKDLHPNINFPNVDDKLKIPDVSLPSLSIPDFKAKMPDLNADMKTPKIDITPKVNLEGKSHKFKKLFKWSHPKASVPDVNLNQPNVNGQVSLPDPKFQGAIKGPNLDLEGPKFDMKTPSAEFQSPKLEMPEMNLSPLKASLPDLNLPSFENARPNVNFPQADVTMPDVDINGPGGEIGTLNMKAPKITGPDGALDLKIPNVNLPGPSIKGGIKLPTFNANVPGAGVDVKSPEVNINGPKLNLDTDGALAGKVNSLNRISGGTFKIRSASVSDLDEPTFGATKGSNLNKQSTSTLNVNGDTKSKKSRFKLPSLSYKSKGSVDLNKAQVESSNTFGSRFGLPEVELSLSKNS